MTLVKCDICGAVVDIVGTYRITARKRMTPVVKRRFDMCDRCALTFRAWVERVRKAENA